MLLWSQSGYECIYEEIYGVDFFTLTQALEEQGLGDTPVPPVPLNHETAFSKKRLIDRAATPIAVACISSSEKLIVKSF